MLVWILQKNRANKISCVYIDTDVEIPYEELGQMMMEAEKFPDVLSASWRPRRAVARLSQKAREPAEPVCEFRSESWQVRDSGGADVSALVQKARKEPCLARPSGRSSLSVSTFCYVHPCWGGQSALLSLLFRC